MRVLFVMSSNFLEASVLTARPNHAIAHASYIGWLVRLPCTFVNGCHEKMTLLPTFELPWRDQNDLLYLTRAHGYSDLPSHYRTMQLLKSGEKHGISLQSFLLKGFYRRKDELNEVGSLPQMPNWRVLDMRNMNFNWYLLFSNIFLF